MELKAVNGVLQSDLEDSSEAVWQANLIKRRISMKIFIFSTNQKCQCFIYPTQKNCLLGYRAFFKKNISIGYLHSQNSFRLSLNMTVNNEEKQEFAEYVCIVQDI